MFAEAGGLMYTISASSLAYRLFGAGLVASAALCNCSG